MAQIYDNIEVKFTDGLQGIISSLGVKRVDFCVGYFNLRGWNLVVDQIDKLPGDVVYENDSKKQAHLQSSVFKLSKDLIDSIHEEGIVAYTS